MKFNPQVSLLILLMASLYGSAQDTERASKERKRMMDAMQKQQTMMRLMSIVHDKALRKELEIIDDQVSDISKVSVAYQREMSNYTAKNIEVQQEATELMRKGNRVEAMKLSKRFQSEIHEICDKYYGQVEEFLLPHQLKRIDQISRQQILKSYSGFGDEFGIPLAVADEIGLTQKQKNDLREAIRKNREKYYQELNKLKAETHQAILKSLPAAKRDELKEIVGDLYDPESARREAYFPSKKRKK